MSWFSRLLTIFAARRSTEPDHPNERRIPFTRRTPAGVYITPDRALTNDVVWACVRYLTQSVAGLPWHVMEEDRRDGRVTRARNSRVDWLLSGAPNPEWRPFQFRETLLQWALLWGNGYAEIERDTAGRAIGLWPIHPERVCPERDPETDALVYEVNNGTRGRAIIPAADMFHLRGRGEGPVGLPLVDYAAQTIGWAQATQLFGATFFGSGASPSGVVQVEGKLTPEAFRELRQQLDRKTGRFGIRTWIFDQAMKWIPTTIEPDKSQFVETMNYQVAAICRWFGVPPHKVQHLLHATFSNIEHQSIEVVVDAILPWVKRFEEEANAKLFAENRRGFLFTKMNLNALLRGDAKTRAEYFQIMRNSGALSVNDIRRLEDMNEIGSEGDVYVMQGQYLPLKVIAEQKAPAASEAGPGTPPSPGNGEPPSPDGEDEPVDEAEARGEIEAFVRMLELSHAN